MLSWAEHEKSFKTSGPDAIEQLVQLLEQVLYV